MTAPAAPRRIVRLCDASDGSMPRGGFPPLNRGAAAIAGFGRGRSGGYLMLRAWEWDHSQEAITGGTWDVLNALTGERAEPEGFSMEILGAMVPAHRGRPMLDNPTELFVIARASQPRLATRSAVALLVAGAEPTSLDPQIAQTLRRPAIDAANEYRVRGWLDLDNAIFFTVDRGMYDRACHLLGAADRTLQQGTQLG